MHYYENKSDRRKKLNSDKKTFFKYVIPSVLGFALSGIYSIVDGFFIGHCMGDAGLAAITIGFPVSAFIQSVGTGIGLSGAVHFAILSARNETKSEQECFAGTSVLMALLSLLLTVVFVWLTEPIIYLFGARGEVHAMAAEYVRVIAVGTVFQLMATGFVPFIRNMGGAPFAMASMILGFVTNIILDYVLVWVIPLGMTGAAWATVTGQGVTLLCAVPFFLKKKYKLRFPSFGKMIKLWLKVLKVSVSPFGMSFSSQLTLLFMNRFLLLYGNNRAVAAFGCIDYILSIIYYLIQGVGDGSQPLISNRYGKNDKDGVYGMRSMAYKFAGAITVVCIIFVFLLRKKIGILFGASESANAEVIKYLPWFLATILFLCFSRMTATYFYATEKNVLAYILVYGETVFTLIFLLLLPLALKLTGVWLAMPLSQIAIFLVALAEKYAADKHEFVR